MEIQIHSQRDSVQAQPGKLDVIRRKDIDQVSVEITDLIVGKNSTANALPTSRVQVKELIQVFYYII